MKDYCGAIARVDTRSIVALPAGGISTLSYDIPIGSTIVGVEVQGIPVSLQSYKSYTKTLNVEDLACPTWGLAAVSYKPSTLPSNLYHGIVVFTQSIVGPPFDPIILPPKELLSLDPAWARCSRFDFVYNLFDPPRALTAIEAMSSASHSAIPTSDLNPVTTTSAKPGDTMALNLPGVTTRPGAADIGRSSSTYSSLLADHSLSPESRQTRSATLLTEIGTSQPADPEQTPAVHPSQTSSLSDSSQIPSLAHIESVLSSASFSQDPALGKSAPISTTAPGQLSSSSGDKSSQKIGALIYSALGGHASSKEPATSTKSNNIPVPTATNLKLDLSSGTFGVSSNSNVSGPENKPSAFHTVVSSTDKPAISISGTLNFIAGGHTFTADSSGFLADGATTISSGSPIGLDPSAKLVVVSRTTVPPSAHASSLASSSILTVNGAVFTANPSGLAIDNNTLVVGGAIITVSGIAYGLESSGMLRIGTNEILLPTGVSNGTVPFLGPAGRKAEVPTYKLFWVSVGVIVSSGLRGAT